MEKTNGIIESREVKDVGEDQLITLTIGGKKFTAFSNSITEDVGARLSEVKQGDEVDLEFTATQKTNRFGKLVTYRNITDIIKVDRGERVGTASAPKSNRMDGKRQLDVEKIVGTTMQYAVLYANQKMATTGQVVELAEVKAIARYFAHAEEEIIADFSSPVSDENGG